jgi:Fe-Mn family superoxide dismutase
MVHVLPSLPYAYDALEPHIDARTMEIHHSKHHQTYIDKLNAGLVGTEYAEQSLEELLQSVALLPDELKPVVKNHG